MNLYQKLNSSINNLGTRINLLIGINVFIFLLFGLLNVLEFLFTNNAAYSNLANEYLAVPSNYEKLIHRIWTIFTYMFMHIGILHILFNMLWLYWIGNILEDFLNKKKVTFIYIMGGIFGALIFIIAFNILPAFNSKTLVSSTLGSSGAVMAIVVATATLLPNYNFPLLLFGNVKLKWLAIIYILIDFLSLNSQNAGGHITHLGGALFGFLFIKSLQRGNDWSKPFERIFSKKHKLKVISKNINSSSINYKNPNQLEIDAILDKISLYGYENLSTQEKQLLFRASNKHEEK